MCGNGARCAAMFISGEKQKNRKLKIQTRAGLIEAEVRGALVKIKLTDPKDIKLNTPIDINGRPVNVDFINTGVPHAVIFVEKAGIIDVDTIGSKVRNHVKFKPGGTNADFVEVLSADKIKVRTYERGVEGETLACGTGSAASALIYALRYASTKIGIIKVLTRGGETLKVYFKRSSGRFINVWLEGGARIIYRGVYVNSPRQRQGSLKEVRCSEDV